ncbi:MAG: ABC transporter permease [Candidatus Methanomethyliaceae archaeon]|nr:ABC transporter permease [Candidatus Methanomethyliaceae archaeon]MDW7971528.1 ABC transporter permease [Nitrososphaerota archaeon]
MIELIIGLLATTMATSTVLILASIGETIVERGGLLNLSIEGTMLIGAFLGFLGAYFTGNLWLGLLMAIIGGIITTLIFGLLVVKLNLNQVISGLAINLLTYGLCLYFFRYTFSQGAMPYLKELIYPLPIPFLSQIPIIGPILFNQTIFVYIALISAPFIYYLLFRTSFGLKLRAIGEDPSIAYRLGINVNKIRYMALILEGILVGMAGGMLCLSMFNVFDVRITGAKGFIAISIVILGRWNPIGALGGAIIFGFTEALSLWVGTLIIGPLSASMSQLLSTLPYSVAIIALLIGGRRAKGPAGLGSPFLKE